MKTVVLVVGSSGVGKSTICKKIIKLSSNVLHLIASNFIKTDGTVDQNQTQLTQAIRDVINESSASLYLIDGHLVFNSFKIPLDALEVLDLDAILVLVDDAEVILQRRSADKTRTRKTESLKEIKDNQDKELAYAEEVAILLKVPITVIKNAMVKDVENTLKKDYGY